MKVASINTVFGIKSTGRNYAELKEYLEKNGHECRAYAALGDLNHPGVYKIGGKFSYYFHNVMSRLVGLEGYFSRHATKKLIKQLEEFNPDIVDLGNLHGHFLNLPLIFK